MNHVKGIVYYIGIPIYEISCMRFGIQYNAKLSIPCENAVLTNDNYSSPHPPLIARKLI